MLLYASVLLVPVKDTVWWNSTAGQVMEHRDENGANCTLTFQSDGSSVVFEWKSTSQPTVTVVNLDWQFPDNWRVPVAMQVGDVWLSNGADSAVIDAVAHGNAITFPVLQPVEPLLAQAGNIEVRAKAGTLRMPLDHVKMEALLDHVQQCRDVITR
ncbi:MAG: hypothetical protein B7Z80_21570 [Rhodospirillales bacterium 20-64-7]|nr:MAG: hypothetical protein B7Z80_21570 [Rhodospirillales bacterium 20-64-7]